MSTVWYRFTTVRRPGNLIRRGAAASHGVRGGRVVAGSIAVRTTGALTAANSARPGVGVSSGSTMPSMTKEPSCTTSLKSPP